MRILHIVPSYKPAFAYGGVPQSVSFLAEEMVKCGAEVWVFTTTANGTKELDVPVGRPQEIEGVQVVYFRRWTGDHSHLCPALWWALWRQGSYFDAVHIHSWWNWVAIGAALICRLRGYRTVFSPHGMLSSYSLRKAGRRFFQRTLGYWLLARARWHATSFFERSEWTGPIREHQVVLLPVITPLPEKPLPLARTRPRNRIRLLYLSRIDPKKGLDFLLETLSTIDRKNEWELLVAGDVDSFYGRAMQRLAHEKGLSDRIRWIGWVLGEEKWRLLMDSDLLVLPSKNENFAIAVLEALAVGTAVVLSDQVGLCDYVERWNFGWVAPLRKEAWNEVLQDAMRDTVKRQQIRQEAPSQISADFNPTSIAKRFLGAYRRRTVCLIMRKPYALGHYSIERSFAALWPYLERAPDLQLQKVVACAPSRGIWPRLRIAAQLFSLHADLFHITGDIHFAALFLPGSKTVLTVHDCGFAQHPNPLKRWLLRWLWLRWPVRHCRHVVAVSAATKADILHYTKCPVNKISVIPSAILPHFQPKPKPFQTERPRILHIGSTPNKNLRRHIEALQGIPCTLHIVGQIGPQERHCLQYYGISYECTPSLDDAGIVHAYEACDMLLFASTFEGFGMPILEAQLVGRPVVTSNISSMPSVAGENGACLVNPFDPSDIRQGILRILRDPFYRERLVKNGLENARRYLPEYAAEAYIALYRRLIF
ncbi:MAG: glycosyltransferase [Saprospiraceae bacterium]|nr:glycosyltransferase [Saprospiraceae bacterium]MDW8483014.1 glycosyltransferase [Saprospiraceae bacterium]